MEETIERKLNALLDLQAIDCELDKIVKMRGVLPEEVEDLENELVILQTRSINIQEELSNLEQDIVTQRTKIKTVQALVKKYEEQQMDVRNNREYDAITKEIDLQKLEIQLAEKKSRGAYEQIDKQKQVLEQCQRAVVENKQALTDKQEALHALMEESQEEEQKLHKRRVRVIKNVDEQLLQSYDRIRANVSNGLAVVVVTREACGGCFSKVPPQKQADVQEKKSIIMCEHCGRIIADVIVVAEPEDE
ncbi:MAG: C4-type zinc ribbon domain-containing protein [Amoebophilaceae bacterium]|jgi:hypothetical protein|nr:C4-type zinc ribbon domain-containing protein [Amoebophilaceae bacterium]